MDLCRTGNLWLTNDHDCVPTRICMQPLLPSDDFSRLIREPLGQRRWRTRNSSENRVHEIPSAPIWQSRAMEQTRTFCHFGPPTFTSFFFFLLQTVRCKVNKFSKNNNMCFYLIPRSMEVIQAWQSKVKMTR